MKTVGASEARTYLSRLLDEVQTGEEVIITRRGQPIARLTRADNPDPERFKKLLAEMRALARGNHTTPEEIREWINEGRRY